MPTDKKPVFADQQRLVSSLYRISGLVDAIYAVNDTSANDQIADGAMNGIRSALERDVADLLTAAEAGDIIVSAGKGA